jgi:hypothetical protein
MWISSGEMSEQRRAWLAFAVENHGNVWRQWGLVGATDQHRARVGGNDLHGASGLGAR